MMYELAVIMTLHEENRGASGTNLLTMRACCLIVRRPVKAKASRLWRALTGQQTRRHAAHRARHYHKEEPV